MSTGQERRSHPRRRSVLGATIRFLDGLSTASCRVRNISAGGAQLEIAGSGWIPARFELEIPHHDLRVLARIVWRTPTAIGIVFGREADALPKSIHEEARIVSLEAERDRLRSRVLHLTTGF